MYLQLEKILLSNRLPVILHTRSILLFDSQILLTRNMDFYLQSTVEEEANSLEAYKINFKVSVKLILNDTRKRRKAVSKPLTLNLQRRYKFPSLSHISFIEEVFPAHLLNLYLKKQFLTFSLLDKNACHFPCSNVCFINSHKFPSLEIGQ